MGRALDYNKASPKLARIGALREESSRYEPAQTGKARRIAPERSA